jgi:hypothetical protein
MDLKLPPIPDWKLTPNFNFGSNGIAPIVSGYGTGKAHFHSDCKITLSRVGDNVVFDITEEGWNEVFEFALNLEDGRNQHFMRVFCPETGKLQDILYYYDGSVFSRDAYNRPGFRRRIHEDHVRRVAVAGLRRARGALWASAAVRLAQLRAVGPGDNFEARAILEAADAKDAAKAKAQQVVAERAERTRARAAQKRRTASVRRKRAQQDPMGTEAGLIGGQGPQARLRRPSAARLEAFLEGGEALEACTRPSPPEKPNRAAMEDHLRIDVRVLHNMGLLHDGEMQVFDLCWPQSNADIDQVCLAVDMRLPEHQIRIAFDRNGEQIVQDAGLRWKMINGRLRPHLVCGRSGETGEVLAYRFGSFAHRQFLTLTYRSQLG